MSITDKEKIMKGNTEKLRRGSRVELIEDWNYGGSGFCGTTPAGSKGRVTDKILWDDTSVRVTFDNGMSHYIGFEFVRRVSR